MTSPYPSLVCPQGHGPGAVGSHFCNWCGAPLVPSPVDVHATYPPPTLNNIHYPPPPPIPVPCSTCGGNGVALAASENTCAKCGWIRPLLPGYQLDASVFQYSMDGQAMNTLRGMTALTSIARSASDKIGRPWIESTFNGILLGPRQLPAVWTQAVTAARILGITKMPEVYVSGDRMWETHTFGSDVSAFVILGTAVVTNFTGDDLLFLLAREMGHVRAGHALWKTVIRFLAGDIGPRGGLMSEGALGALSPTKLIESTIEMPLMAWSRQSEITADRAGLLAVGSEEVVRRVLLAWSIRSALLVKQINLEAWMEQEEGSSDQVTRLSEMTSSSTMYTTRRLRLLSQFAREPELMRWSQSIQACRPKPSPLVPSPGIPKPQPPPTNVLRFKCPTCKAALSYAQSLIQGRTKFSVRCPKCRSVVPVILKAAPTLAMAAK